MIQATVSRNVAQRCGSISCLRPFTLRFGGLSDDDGPDSYRGVSKLRGQVVLRGTQPINSSLSGRRWVYRHRDLRCRHNRAGVTDRVSDGSGLSQEHQEQQLKFGKKLNFPNLAELKKLGDKVGRSVDRFA